MAKKRAESKKSLWIVVEYTFDYNDETYSQQEGSHPVIAFDTEAEALKYCDDLNIEELKGKDLREYCYSLPDITDNAAGVEEWFNRHRTQTEYPLLVPSRATKKDLIELYNMLEIQFHSVREVPYFEPEKSAPPAKDGNRFLTIGRDEE